MGSETALAVFLAEFDFQADQIKQIHRRLADKLAVFEKQDVAREMVESTGYWLHNLYCAYEDLFKLVSAFWENNVPAEGEYHVNLLKRMRIAIKDIRPALLSDAAYAYLNELRGFRHVFRHAYTYGLDDERVHYLMRKTIAAQKPLMTDVKCFRRKMAGMLNS